MRSSPAAGSRRQAKASLASVDQSALSCPRTTAAGTQRWVIGTKTETASGARGRIGGRVLAAPWVWQPSCWQSPLHKGNAASEGRRRAASSLTRGPVVMNLGSLLCWRSCPSGGHGGRLAVLQRASATIGTAIFWQSCHQLDEILQSARNARNKRGGVGGGRGGRGVQVYKQSGLVWVARACAELERGVRNGKGVAAAGRGAVLGALQASHSHSRSEQRCGRWQMEQATNGARPKSLPLRGQRCGSRA